jgi:hypothetical protein
MNVPIRTTASTSQHAVFTLSLASLFDSTAVMP